jgi:hypothetical protein
VLTIVVTMEVTDRWSDNYIWRWAVAISSGAYGSGLAVIIFAMGIMVIMVMIKL